MYVLIPTFNFPPLNRMGSGRVYSWAQALAESGHRVVVLTPEKTESHGPLDYEKACDGFEVVSLATPKWGLRSSRSRRMGWVSASYEWLRRQSTAPDAIVSSLGPPESHFVAALAKRRFPNAHWIADYRDLWFGNAYDSRSLAQFSRRLIEPRLIRNAGTLTTVSEGFASALRGFHQSREVVVIYNGYEGAPARVAVQGARQRPLRIVHTGTIYSGRRDPSPLFRALRLMLDRGDLSEGDLVVEFFGAELGNVADLSATHGVTELTTIAGHVSRNTALANQASADALLLLDWSAVEADGTIPGKLYEYMRSMRPVLGIGVTADSTSGRMLSEAGIGVPCGTDPENVANALSGLIQGTPPWFSPQRGVIDRFSRSAQAQVLVELVERVMQDR